MGERKEICLKKAAECERMAVLVSDETIRSVYLLDLATRWATNGGRCGGVWTAIFARERTGVTHRGSRLLYFDCGEPLDRSSACSAKRS